MLSRMMPSCHDPLAKFCDIPSHWTDTQYTHVVHDGDDDGINNNDDGGP